MQAEGQSREGLTGREREVVSLVAQGLTNGQIAAALGISATTAKWHVSQILRKLNISRRVGLAVYALKTGQVEGAERWEQT